MLRALVTSVVRPIRVSTNWYCSTAEWKEAKSKTENNINDPAVAIPEDSEVFSELEIKNLGNLEQIKKYADILKGYEFSKHECVKMIKSYPELLKIPEHQFKATLQQWSNSQLGFDNFKKILLNQPIFLKLDVNNIIKKMRCLLPFHRSKTSLTSLLLTCPVIMFNSWDTTEQIIDYLMIEKGLKWGEIIQSRALSLPLDFIKMRFDIAEKCGVYKVSIIKTHKENQYGTVWKNPHLKKIVDSNDNVFAKQVANISLEEYNVCKELFYTKENDDIYTSDESDDEKTGYEKVPK